MKLKLIHAIILFVFVQISFAQSLIDVSRSKEITWYGIDFTQAKLISFDTLLTKNLIKDSLIKYWDFSNIADNNTSLLKRCFGKKNIFIENLKSIQRNSSINFDNILTNQSHEINNDLVINTVSEYAISGSGYGILLIVEYFVKPRNLVSIWVTYINKENGQVISSRRYRSTASGFGMLNHWLNGIEEVLKIAGSDLKNYK